MAEFFCVYSGKKWPESERSTEHIVPYGIGGSDGLVINDVATKPNNDVGSFVDGLLMGNWLVAGYRWNYKIKSQKGNIPPVVFVGTVELNGKAVPATYSIAADGKLSLELRPDVKSDWDGRKIEVTCDPRDLPTIMRNIEKKAQKKGLKLLDKDVQIAQGKTVHVAAPEMQAVLSMNVFDLVPCFIKMAVGVGHKTLGYSWSMTRMADQLRLALGERNLNSLARHPIHGQVWPSMRSSMKDVMFVGANRHVLMVLNANPLSFYGLLFGEFEGCIQLSDGVWPDRIAAGEGIVFVIDHGTRGCSEYRFAEFVAHRQAGAFLPHVAPFAASRKGNTRGHR